MSQPASSEGRVARVPLETSLARVRELGFADGYAQMSIIRVLLRHPTVAKPLFALLLALIDEGRLDERLRELVIMRVGWITGSDYEWTQHWRIATDQGVPTEDLLAVREGPASARFGELERAVLQATDETVTQGAIAAETWARLEKLLTSDEERVELVTVIGAWRMISSMLRSLGVPHEDGVASWPPDGVGPKS